MWTNEWQIVALFNCFNIACAWRYCSTSHADDQLKNPSWSKSQTILPRRMNNIGWDARVYRIDSTRREFQVHHRNIYIHQRAPRVRQGKRLIRHLIHVWCMPDWIPGICKFVTMYCLELLFWQKTKERGGGESDSTHQSGKRLEFYELNITCALQHI